jgi:hypothetical protein
VCLDLVCFWDGGSFCDLMSGFWDHSSKNSNSNLDFNISSWTMSAFFSSAADLQKFFQVVNLGAPALGHSNNHSSSFTNDSISWNFGEDEQDCDDEFDMLAPVTLPNNITVMARRSNKRKATNPPPTENLESILSKKQKTVTSETFPEVSQTPFSPFLFYNQ